MNMVIKNFHNFLKHKMASLTDLHQEKQHLEFKVYQCKIHDLFFEIDKYEYLLSEVNKKIENYEINKKKNRKQIHSDKFTNK